MVYRFYWGGGDCLITGRARKKMELNRSSLIEGHRGLEINNA